MEMVAESVRPFRLAERVTICVALATVGTVKEPLDWPGEIVKTLGTGAALLLLESTTVALPAGGLLRSTVQSNMAPLGVQPNEVICAVAFAVRVVCTEAL